jgi:hypothetical protein
MDVIVTQKNSYWNTDLLTQRPVFDSWPAHVGFAIHHVVLEQVFLQLLPFYPIIIILQMLRIRISFIYHQRNKILLTRSVVKQYSFLFVVLAFLLPTQVTILVSQVSVSIMFNKRKITQFVTKIQHN